MVFDELRDVSTMFGRMCYNPDFGPELKKTFLESVPAKLKRLDKYFTSEFAAGSAITIADFQVRAHACSWTRRSRVLTAR